MTQKVRMVEYLLAGQVGYWDRKLDKPDVFIGGELDTSFLALSDDEAVTLARERVESFLARHTNYDPRSDESDTKKFFWFSLSKKMWRMEFVNAKEGRPAIPAQPAVDPIPAAVQELMFD